MAGFFCQHQKLLKMIWHSNMYHRLTSLRGKLAGFWEHYKANKMTCAPSKDSDQPGHPPGLIRVFTMGFMGSWGPIPSSGLQKSLWSDWADAQADLSHRWAHRSFCWFYCVPAHMFCFVLNSQESPEEFADWAKLRPGTHVMFRHYYNIGAREKRFDPGFQSFTSFFNYCLFIYGT